MSQVVFFFGAGRWRHGKRIRQNENCLKMWRHRILLMIHDVKAKLVPLPREEEKEEKGDESTAENM